MYSDCPKMLWHYTSLDVLRHFCCDDKQVFFASHNMFSNDEMEADGLIKHLALEVMKRTDASRLTKKYCEILLKDRYSDAPRACFIISLTECDDALPLWNEYTSRSPYGIAIGFKVKRTGRKHLLRKCRYYETIKSLEDKFVTDMEAAIRRLSRAVSISFRETDWNKVERSRLAVDRVVESLAYMKHKSFEYEQEWRFVIERPLNKSVCFTDRKPYIKIPLFGVGGLFSEIAEIRMSPYADRPVVRRYCETLYDAGYIKTETNSKDLIKESSSSIRHFK